MEEKSKAMFNWFPGHMSKALNDVIAKIKEIDLVIEVIDARAPISTQNRTLNKIIKDKLKLLIITKSDLADPEVNKEWHKYFENKNQPYYVFVRNSSQTSKDIFNLLTKIVEPLAYKQKCKGIDNPIFNIIILGIPNVGKSTVISKIVKTKLAKSGNVPGITRGQQIFTFGNNFILIDTPGILPSKFETEHMAYNCAAVNAIKIDVVPKERFASKLLKYIYDSYPGFIERHFDIKKHVPRPISYKDAYKIFEEIAKRNQKFIFEDMPDFNWATWLFINHLLTSKIRGVSFETPLDYGDKKIIEEEKTKYLNETVILDDTIEW